MKFKQICPHVICTLMVFICFSKSQAQIPMVQRDGDTANNIFIVSLNDGDSLVPKLAQVAKSYNIKSGLILANTGKIRNFTMSFYDLGLRRYYSKYYYGPYNFNTTFGTFAQSSTGDLNLDIVAVCDSTNTDLRCSDVTTRSIGGHLIGGIVSAHCTIIIKKLQMISFVRDYNLITGCWDWTVNKFKAGAAKETDNDSSTISTSVLKSKRNNPTNRNGILSSTSNGSVFDVAGRRVNISRTTQTKKTAPGLYITKSENKPAEPEIVATPDAGF